MKANRTIRNTILPALTLTLALGLLAACGTPDTPADGVPSGTGEGTPPPAATVPEETTAEDTAEETTAAETQPETEAHVHAFGEWITVREATCETIGKQERVCACGETEEQKLKKTGHTPVATPTVEPTLTENGSTGGEECGVCGKVLTQPTALPYIGHTGLAYEVNEDGKTCTVTGLGECTETDLYIPATIDGYTVTHVGDGAFYGRADLVAVHFPLTMIHLGEASFYGCTSLAEVVMSDSITTMGYMAFLDCSSLTDLTLSHGLTAISQNAFDRCTSLVEVTVPDGVKTLEWSCFSSCSSLQKVQLPPSVESIGIIAFQGCSALSEINLDEGLLSIKDMAFEGCVSLTSLRIPSSLRILGDYAFAHCTGITAERIVLPDQMHTLGKQVFMDGPTIKEIVFLAEPKFPNTDALQDCAGLTDVYYHGTEALWKVNGYLVDEGVTVHFGYTGN